MAQVEMARISQLDETYLVDRLMPKTWKCPHCGKRNKTGIYADEILIDNFKYLEHCGCGYVHIWYLQITDGFKRQVVSMLMEGN